MMLEFLETGKALYVLTAVCVLGLFSRLMARNLYKRLIKETDNMTLTKNRYLRDLKQRAENTYRLNQGIHNTKAYLEKQLTGYRFLGLTLNGWGNLSGQFTVLCFLLGGAAAFASYWYRCDNYYIILYGTVGIMTGLLTLFVDCGINLPERKNQLLNALQDYMENSLFHRLARETASAMEDDVRDGARDGYRGNYRDSGVRGNGIRDIASRDGGRDSSRGNGRETGIRDLNIRELNIRDLSSSGKGAQDEEQDDEARDSAVRGGVRSLSRSGRGKTEKAGSGAGGDGREEPALERPAKKTGRLLRKEQPEDSVSVPIQEKAEPRKDVDYLKHSLEQIAASREKNRGEGDWIKDLSPDELELVGEILKQYLA